MGPAGSQFGLLACLVVEVLNMWPMLQRPENALMKLLGIVLVLFLFGLLPWIDNYAHFFGFVFGFLLSYAFLPFVSFGPYDRAKKVTLIWICLLSAGIIFGVLVVLFYIVPVYECQICNYFNCVPLTKDFCAEQNINFIKSQSSGIVWPWNWLWHRHTFVLLPLSPVFIWMKRRFRGLLLQTRHRWSNY